MPGWNPDALVSRKVATHAAISDVGSTSDAWRSAAAKHEQKRWAEQSEKALQSDATFKRHQTNVDKALSRFENVGEWADFISFLSRLLKTLQSAPKFNAIPHKLIVAKRLSQCLNPALPSGVHTRALDVYSHIFSVIGVEGLRRDLPVWTPGLLPFFQNAATSVRPAVLHLLDQYYVPLGADLRPVTRALLLSLLPGLEEESGEFFDRVVGLLDQIATSVGREFFLQTTWLVLISSQPIRLSALNYLARRMPKLKGTKADPEVSIDQSETSVDIVEDEGIPLTSLRPGLLVRGFMHTLGDDSLLVRRNALDFLVSHLPLASQAFSEVAPGDRVLLIDAAISAVLRRDISLNRRLYAWLLGANDDEDTQQAYFVQHALPYATSALRTAMQVKPSDAAAVQRPYKILVSLMDKSAVGQPLLRAIILDAFHALVHDTHLNPSSELFPTAQMLFEAVDTFVLYQQLFLALRDELQQETSDVAKRCGSAIQLFHEILAVFDHHDEDAVAVHLPILYLALVDMVQRGIESKRIGAPLVLNVLALLETLQEALPPRVYVQDTQSVQKPLGYAATYVYVDGGALDHAATLQDQGQVTHLVEALLRIGLTLGPASPWSKEERRMISTRCFSLLVATLERLDAARGVLNASSDEAPPTTLGAFDAQAWDVKTFAHLSKPTSFAEYALLLKVAMGMSLSDAVPGSFRFDLFESYESTLLPLLAYLQPSEFAHHAEAADLFWAVKSMSENDYATSILCSRILERTTRGEALHALGTLWRLGEGSGHAQELTAPMLIVLDQLRSHSIQERSDCAMWLRTYLGSYDTLFSMVLDRLLSIHAERTPQTVTVAEQALQAYVYAEPFDQDEQNYYLATLTSLLDVGGAHLVASARDMPRGDAMAIDALTAHLVVLLRSAPPAKDWLAEGNEATHALALSLLQQILAADTLDRAWCTDVQHHLVETLLIALYRRNGATQIAVLRTLLEVVQKRSDTLDDDTSVLFTELIKRGLQSTPNDAAFFAWTEFVHRILPLARDSVNELLLPLCAAVCELLAEALDMLAAQCGDAEWRQAFVPARTVHPQRTPATELEIAQLISVVEHALLQAMSSGQLIEAERLADLELTASTGFLGNISSVFTSDTASGTPAVNPSPVLRTASQVVHTLEYAWVISKGLDAHFLPNVYKRSTASLERLYRMQTTSAVEAVIENWWIRAFQDSDDARTRIVNRETVALLECLTSSPQVLVSSLSDAILSRTAQSNERKKSTARTLVGELVLFRFLEQYLNGLDTTAIVQVWPLISLLAKNISSNHAANKALIYHTLRIVTTVGTPLALSRAYEDRRTRRDVQDTFVRLCEQVISLYARALDISAARRNAKDSDALSGMDTPEDASTATTTAAPAPAYVVSYMSAAVLPAFTTFAIETDRVVALCTSLVYYVLAPGFRARARSMDVDPLVLEMLSSMCRVSGTIKTWRALVLDTILDPKFFSLSPATGKQWAEMVAALYAAERDRLVDVIGRISNTPTNNLFTSRETDLMARAVSIRRLSYSIYAGGRDVFLAQLPQIQEKVVDILRSNAPELVQAEIYLCMRVLLCRFASQHLTGFWPIILTELLRLFGMAKTELPQDNTDSMHLLFSTSKLVDYLLTLQTEDFQIHQWLLITDTPDAIDPPPEWLAESLLDAIGNLAIEHNRTATPEPYVCEPGHKRRPMLQTARADTAAALVPFFMHASEAFYDNEYTCSELDWDNINHGLLCDLFEPIVIKS